MASCWKTPKKIFCTVRSRIFQHACTSQRARCVYGLCVGVRRTMAIKLAMPSKSCVSKKIKQKIRWSSVTVKLGPPELDSPSPVLLVEWVPPSPILPERWAPEGAVFFTGKLKPPCENHCHRLTNYHQSLHSGVISKLIGHFTRVHSCICPTHIH